MRARTWPLCLQDAKWKQKLTSLFEGVSKPQVVEFNSQSQDYENKEPYTSCAHFLPSVGYHSRS